MWNDLQKTNARPTLNKKPTTEFDINTINRWIAAGAVGKALRSLEPSFEMASDRTVWAKTNALFPPENWTPPAKGEDDKLLGWPLFYTSLNRQFNKHPLAGPPAQTIYAWSITKHL